MYCFTLRRCLDNGAKVIISTLKPAHQPFKVQESSVSLILACGGNVGVLRTLEKGKAQGSSSEGQ